MRERLSLVRPIVCLTVIFGFTSPALAGDLNPPPGPIGPTMKTLNEVEPRTVLLLPSGGAAAARGPNPIIISAPGSYKLGAGLLATTADAGIEIAASDVSLDLNGMVLDGADVGTDGIIVLGDQTNIAIFNGSLTRWTESGVDASTALGSQFWDLRISDFGSASSSDDGLHAGTGATVSRCAVFGPLPHSGDVDDGIDMHSGVVSNCTVSQRAGRGIHVGFGSTVTDCTVVGVTAGGIVADHSSTIRNCTVSLSVGGSSGNGAIEVGSDCYVVGNTCSTAPALAGFGIIVSGRGNRIEQNNVIARDRLPFGAGIYVTGTFNVILKNTVTGSGDHYEIGASNSYGPIVAVPGIGDISIVVGASHPWANFSY